MSVVIWVKPSPLLSTYLIRKKIVIAGEITEADKVLLLLLKAALIPCAEGVSVLIYRWYVLSWITCSAIGAFALVKRAMLNGILLQHLLEN